MGIGNMLKDFLYEKSDGVTVETPSEVKKEETPAQPVQQQTFQPATSQYTATAVIDKDILDFLNKKVEQNNIDGFDYFEFKKSVENSKNIIPDERVRFQAAFSFASTNNISKERLIETAKFYIDVIKKEEAKFSDAFNKSVDSEINSKQTEINNIDLSVNDKVKQLEDINKQITDLQNQKTQLSSEIASNKVKLEANKNNFLYVVNTIVEGINNDINKINNYLGVN